MYVHTGVWYILCTYEKCHRNNSASTFADRSHISGLGTPSDWLGKHGQTAKHFPALSEKTFRYICFDMTTCPATARPDDSLPTTQACFGWA